MESRTGHLSDLAGVELSASYRTHGKSAMFWDDYQRVLVRMTEQDGSKIAVANRLAAIAEQLGAVDKALKL
ncbi:hypothetical protein [Stenotrophomonas sp. MMGLT7]|uniref:hypothetical protein n=1 Tax=Stenotrophomonas sp. MMGLT7 TaxID=2901227 RepID=UPI001E5F9345|nr:hypothetical protein [Stenotrophomonas sp. MMGLT7]